MSQILVNAHFRIKEEIAKRFRQNKEDRFQNLIALVLVFETFAN